MTIMHLFSPYKAVSLRLIVGLKKILCNFGAFWSIFNVAYFSKNWPLGRFFLVVAMSVCLFVCPLPMGFFFRPLIGVQVT